MDGQTKSLEEYRRWLQVKIDAGVSQVRVTTALAALPTDLDAVGSGLRALRDYNTVSFWTPNGEVEVKGPLVGTAEAAATLRVERPRIGRWKALDATKAPEDRKLPEWVADLAAGPVWFRPEIEAMVPVADARRKPRSEVV